MWRDLEPLFTRALTGETVTVDLSELDGAATFTTTFAPVRRGGVVVGGSATSRAVDHQDPLTGLLNRHRFEVELGTEVTRVRRSSRPAAVLRLDLDGFRELNDAVGHTAGDMLLRRVATAVRGRLPTQAILARVGGDELAAILPDTDAAGALAVAESLLQTVREHGRCSPPGRYAEITASIGITAWTGAVEEDGEELLAQADIALDQAKQAGRDRAATYERREQRRAHLTRRGNWVGRLREAVSEGHFVLHAQPIVPLAASDTGAERFELLLRLQDPRGLLAPGAFLPHAERHGLIGDIDRWVLGQAVGLLHDAAAAGRRLELGVNLSARTLQDPGIADHLERLLADRPVPAGSLTIEVTETAAITDLRLAGVVARELRAHGCRLALDDFGAGFASLAYAKHLSFDELKVDGDFVVGLPNSRTDRLVVRAIVAIAQGLGATTTAEYVGSQDTVELLTELGVDHGQGFFLGRPAPLPAHLPTLPAIARSH
jgi:diguanylate cyclase (GGDEF)-like protein